MTNRPRTSLGRVLDDLGDTLLELFYGDADRPDEIGGVVIYDPLDEPLLPPRSLVLGVGLSDSDAAELLPNLGQQGAVALVLRAPIAEAETVMSAADDAGVAILALTRGATWAQLAALLRSVLAEGDVGVSETETIGGMPAGDLFTLANAIGALLDAPITIEDRNSRVLAFSGRQHEADPSRVETILGRQVPERYSKMLTERGIFGELYRSQTPVSVAPLPLPDGAFTVPRMAMAVRAGDELLGSIWAATREPLTAERSQAMVDAATLVALHLLRVRAGADSERRLRADLVGRALEGGTGSREALARLGLGDQPVAVLAVSTRQLPDAPASLEVDTSRTAERERLSDAFAMHLSATHPRSAVALLGDVAYGLVPTGQVDSATGHPVARSAADFLDRVAARFAAVVALGPVTTATTSLPDSRDHADRVLRVLRAGHGSQRVATLADVHVASLLLELRDLVASRGDRPSGVLAELRDYDAKHNAQLVRTLGAYLDAFGDVSAAAASIYIHPNTFRYRLRRLAKVGGIDLSDPEARFAAMLQLRVVEMGA